MGSSGDAGGLSEVADLQFDSISVTEGTWVTESYKWHGINFIPF